MPMTEKDIINIKIPASLAQRLEKRLGGTNFNSLSSYVTYILRQVISKIEDDEEKKAVKEDEEKKIKKRLRNLGYIE